MNDKVNPWADDKLGRKAQAKAISDYLVNRSENRRNFGLAKGFVIAIESEYGQGKSYFVRNMKQDLSTKHPVCLIDAWSDDRLKSPFLAILDGIENALSPFFNTNSNIRETTAKLIEGSGKLITGVAIGAGKKMLEKAVGAGTEELFEEVMDADDEDDTLESVEPSDIGAEGVKEGLDRIKSLSDSVTKKALKEFRQRKLSSSKLRRRLALLSEQIDQSSSHKLPIFIFIDELDRCRPDYAIQLLEEVKHLFDVPGFVFVLSMQKEQLLNAICSVYGSEFNASGYLDRFVDKYYLLNTPNCREFVELELSKEPLGTNVFLPDVARLTDAQRIAMVFNHFGVSLREMERAIDIIRASIVLLDGIKVDAIQLTRQVIQDMGIPVGDKKPARAAFEAISFEWVQVTEMNRVKRAGKVDNFEDIARALSQYSSWNSDNVQQQIIHVKKPELYYAHHLMVQFFEQFEYQQPDSFSMASLCREAIVQVKSFDYVS